jgi:hypothetical protein
VRFLLILLTIALLLPIPLRSAPATALPPGDMPPPTPSERVKRAGTAADFDDAPYVIVLDSTVNRINDLGIAYTSQYVLYKALSEEGCRELAVLVWGYEPLSSYTDVIRVTVLRGDSLIDVSVRDTRDLPAPQSAIYWGNRIKLLQLPRLHVGDGVEVVTSRKGYSYALLDGDASAEDNRYVPPMRGEYFDIVLFRGTEPIIEKKYLLALPAAKRLHSQVYNGPLFAGTSYVADTTFYSWTARNMPAWKPQRSHPDNNDLMPKVVLATVESWEAKSRWFFEVNDGQFASSEPIKEKVREILTQAGVANGTDDQKAFELVHWVAQNIRYSGQSMGKGEGYTLHPGDMIFEQRSGVCKDIAGMLITMMRAAGLEANPAMTMAGSRIEEIPADQFNHCVVALHKADGSYVMYDPTWVPDYKDIWSKSESEQHYLIGSATGERLSRIRYSPPGESPMHVSHVGRISPDGALQGEFSFTSDGSMDSRLRRICANNRRSEISAVLAGMLKVISDRIEITSVEHGNHLDFKTSMWWRVKYRVPEYAVPVANGLEFRSPMMLLTTNSSTMFGPATGEWPEKRSDDVFLYTTQLLDGKETLQLPSGYKVQTPAQGKKVEETYAGFSGTAAETAGTFTVSQQMEVKRRQIPPDGYPGFRKMIKEAKDYAGTWFRAEKGGAR